MHRLLAVLLIPLCLAAGAWDGGDDEDDRSVGLSGRVVDAEGQPVVGARVATSWTLRSGTLPVPYDDMVSGEDGRFSGSIEVLHYPVTLSAYSADGALAGVVSVDDAAAAGDIRLALEPSVRVVGELTRSGLETPLDQAYLSLTVGSSVRLSGSVRGGEAFGFPVPRGDVKWMAYDSWFSMLDGLHALKPEEVEVDLGSLDIPAHVLAKHVGKPLPEWSVSASRGVPLDQSTLAAHRGKWLLIEFWGFW